MKWIGGTAAVVVASVSIVGYALNLSSRVDRNVEGLASLKELVTRSAVDAKTDASKVDAESQRRNDQQEREIDNLKARTDRTEQTMMDMKSKLDVMIAISTRVEASLNEIKQQKDAGK